MNGISLKVKSLDNLEDLKQYLKRDHEIARKTVSDVENILEGVRSEGDAALIRYSHKYDGYDPKEIGQIVVNAGEIEEAAGRAEKNMPGLIDAIKASRSNIERYHREQLKSVKSSWRIETGPGKELGQKAAALQRAGLYIPGGRYVYPSTVLMTAIPAIIAGVDDIIVCSPPDRNGKLNDILLYLCRDLGISEIYKIGGAQAIAAMAYGTSTIRRVDKIAGPGNIYVTLAKKSVYGLVGIDSLAGPSDITIIADDEARADFIALDLVSQAEHDPLSKSILLTTSRGKAQEVICSIDEYMKEFGSNSRQKGNFDTAVRSLNNNCILFYSRDMDLLIKASNIIAPEHLEIMASDNEYILEGIKNAGAIFIGDYTPVA
ncbi:MAG: histidinol dehydrogenase, partial [Actinobacteria bacterium]|nr:histidinol dehydrogenase [Actinomycetota bacterium]